MKPKTSEQIETQLRRRDGREKFARHATKIAVSDRFGALTVESCLGLRLYATRQHLFWLCRCDCGQSIELPAVKLINKTPKLNYTTCESCSRKKCVMCGEKFPRTRRYDFCDALACCARMRRVRADAKNERVKQRRQSDPQLRAKMAEQWRRWREAHPGHTWQWVQSLPPGKRKLYLEKNRESQRNK